MLHFFEENGRSEIVLFFGSSLFNFLKRGFNFACLQSSGKHAREIERLQSSVIGVASIDAPPLRNFPARLSGPAAFEGFIPSRSLKTLSWLMW